jgi:hypothetical protein
VHNHNEKKTNSGAITCCLLAGRVQVMFDTVLSASRFTKDPDIRKQLDALGLLVDGSGPAAFSAFIDEESARMDKLIKKAGIRFE